MKNDYIKKGDIVKVDFNNVQITLTHKAKVLNVPLTGLQHDFWVFETLDKHKILYVSEPCTITKLGES